MNAVRDAILAVVYPEVNPLKAYRLDVSHGRDACETRWHWVPPLALAKTIAEGRLLAGDGHKCARPGAVERHRTIVGAVFEHGGVGPASAALGISVNMIFHALRSQGVRNYPRMTDAERTRKSAASRQRNRAAAAAAEQALPP